MFYKTNAGLGYQEYAIFFKLNEKDFICIELNVNQDNNSDPYILGEITNDFSKDEIDKIDYDINNSPLPKDLLSAILNKNNTYLTTEAQIIADKFSKRYLGGAKGRDLVQEASALTCDYFEISDDSSLIFVFFKDKSHLIVRSSGYIVHS
jgi:hypothetical protein